ncbi:MAG: RCC1 domain-containing protein [Coxiellaceae bacterium]|nr:RCC1 domain-containing protein [Coxiellaceae bacterium]
MTRPTASNLVKFFKNKAVNKTIGDVWLTGADRINAAIVAFQARERIKIVSGSFKPDLSIMVALDGRVFVFGEKASGLLGRLDEEISADVPKQITTLADTKIVKVVRQFPEIKFFSNDGRIYISKEEQRYPDPSYFTAPICPLPSGLHFSKTKHDYYLADSGRHIYYIAKGWRDGSYGHETLLLTQFPKGTRIVDFKRMPDQKLVYFTDKGEIYESSLRPEAFDLSEHVAVKPKKINIPHPMFCRSTPIIDVSISPSINRHTLYLGANGRVYSQGDNYNFQLGRGDNKDRKQATEIKALRDHRIIKAVAGYELSVFLSDKGKVFICGKTLRFGDEFGTYGGRILKKPTDIPAFSNEHVSPRLDVVDIDMAQFPHFNTLVLTTTDGTKYECDLSRTTTDVFYSKITKPTEAGATADAVQPPFAGRALPPGATADDEHVEDNGAGVGLAPG